MIYLKENSNVVKEKDNVTKEFVKAQRQISSLFVVIPQRKALYLQKIDSINETFLVLKDNELRQYGEYRTKRLVLEAWNKFGYNN